MKQLKKIGKYLRRPSVLLFFSCLFVVLSGGQASWAAVTATAVVEHDRVYVGESFILQIQVEGDDSPTAPDLSTLPDFTVKYQGGQSNNSSSISIINGHMSRVSHHGYVFNYALTPQKVGRLTIPELEVKAGGGSCFTLPVTITAMRPHETNDFKLRLRLAKKQCYVGEPVKLTITWYIGKDVQGFNFNLPILSDKRFSVQDDPAAPSKANNTNLLAIPLGKGEVVARKSNGSLNGRDYLTVSFSRILVPLTPGKLTLPQATVSAKALTAHRMGGLAHDPFANFFNDDFFGRSGNVYRTVVVPSDTPTLTVMPLPDQGRPADFNGLVGDYSILVAASPTKVKVGDPITLNIQVAGDYADNVELPSLRNQLPDSDFKVPAEMAPGVSQGMLKTFTQTVRARRTGVREIPSLSLSFFNSKSGKYETVSSKPVPLQVSANRIVTARDAEGGRVPGVTKKDIHASKGGINYNYEGTDVLVNHVDDFVGPPDSLYVLIFVGTPIFLYGLCLLVIQITRIRRRNPATHNRRKAYGALQAALQSLDDETDFRQSCKLLDEALRNYLRARFRLQAAVFTCHDLEPIMAGNGIEQETIDKLKELMNRCEAGQYAGGAASDQTGKLLVMAAEVVKRLERR